MEQQLDFGIYLIFYVRDFNLGEMSRMQVYSCSVDEKISLYKPQ